MNASLPLSAAPDATAVALHGVGALAHVGAELDALEHALQAAGHWRPGQAVLAELRWCREKVAQLSAAWGHKLIVALVGPSGAGKSTLLNALAGRELAPTGRTRPTTRQVLVYTRSLSDADELVAHCGADQVRVETDYQAAGLEHLILVDTPDTNTLPANQSLLARVLERADLLLTVFPAHNPKLYDNIAFLRPYVRQLPPEAVVPVLNWVDRVPRRELEEAILPDFRRQVAQEWGLATPQIYLLSAKASMPGISFPEDERPLHDLNQLGDLRAWLYGALNQAGQVADRRLARAEHLLQLLKADCRLALQSSAATRAEAQAGLIEFERQAQQALVEQVLPSTGRAPGLEQQAALYAALAARWWGPVGWLVMLWSLFLHLGSSISRWRRRPRLSWPPAAASAEAEAARPQVPAESAAWRNALERFAAEHWPPLADKLVAAGYEATVRSRAAWEEWARWRGEMMAVRWAQVQTERLGHITNILAAWPMPLLFNAPTLGLIGWAGVQTVAGFLHQQYLPADYFRHAALAVLVTWLVSFITLQLVISVTLRLAGQRSLARALRGAAGGAAFPWQEEWEALLALERDA